MPILLFHTIQKKINLLFCLEVEEIWQEQRQLKTQYKLEHNNRILLRK